MHKRDKTGTMRLLCHIVPVSVIPLPPGVYFGIKSFSPPDPAPVWLKLPPRVKMILKDGQDCRLRAAEMNPPRRTAATYFPHLPMLLKSSQIFAFTLRMEGSSTSICTLV